MEAKLGVYFQCQAMDRDTALLPPSPPPPLPPPFPLTPPPPSSPSAPSLAWLTLRVADPIKRFPLSSAHLARVASFDPLAGLCHLTLKPTTLRMAVMSLDDLQAGQLVAGTVDSFHGFGMLVALSPHIKALVPPLHFADIPLSDPRKAYKAGQKVRTRVLHVDAKSRHVLLSLKKTLVSSPYPPVRSLRRCAGGLDPARVGDGGRGVRCHRGDVQPTEGPCWGERSHQGRVRGGGGRRRRWPSCGRKATSWP